MPRESGRFRICQNKALEINKKLPARPSRDNGFGVQEQAYDKRAAKATPASRVHGFGVQE